MTRLKQLQLTSVDSELGDRLPNLDVQLSVGSEQGFKRLLRATRAHSTKGLISRAETGMGVTSSRAFHGSDAAEDKLQL